VSRGGVGGGGSVGGWDATSEPETKMSPSPSSRENTRGKVLKEKQKEKTGDYFSTMLRFDFCTKYCPKVITIVKFTNIVLM
jgi:hypothetical protein